MSYGPPFNEAEIAARKKTADIFARLARMHKPKHKKVKR